MKQWKYKIVEADSLNEPVLNKLGRDGWELCSAGKEKRTSAPTGYVMVWIFKQQLKPILERKLQKISG